MTEEVLREWYEWVTSPYYIIDRDGRCRPMTDEEIELLREIRSDTGVYYVTTYPRTTKEAKELAGVPDFSENDENVEGAEGSNRLSRLVSFLRFLVHKDSGPV